MPVYETSCYYCGGRILSVAIEGVTDHLGISVDSWRFLRCNACGSLLLSPRPEDDRLASFYPPEYSAGRCAARTSFGARAQDWLFYRWVHRGQAQRLLRALGRGEGHSLRLLDIGCGNGFFLQQTTALGFAATGSDWRAGSDENLNDGGGIPVVRARAHDLSTHFSPQTFDVIAAFHVVEHLPAPSLALTHWFDLLKPGGTLVLGAPLIDSWQASIFGRRWSAIRDAPRHLSVPSRAGLHLLLAGIGFREIQRASLQCAPPEGQGSGSTMQRAKDIPREISSSGGAARDGTPAWITPELIAWTIRVWQPHYETRLTPEDAVIMIQNVGRLIGILSRVES